MVFKKYNGKIFGVELSKKEKEVFDQEVQKQLAEYDRRNAAEVDAIALWILHEMFGFGEKRLRAFYDSFHNELAALLDRYKMEKSDAVWLCTYKLKECGIDIRAWNQEDDSDTC